VPVMGEKRSTTRAAVVACIARVKDTAGALPGGGFWRPVAGTRPDLASVVERATGIEPA
jgi:hypothetical protein